MEVVQVVHKKDPRARDGAPVTGWRRRLRMLSTTSALHAPPASASAQAASTEVGQYEAGLPREWAEGHALLNAMPCPTRASPQRWQCVIDDAASFAERRAVQAAGLGWRTLDVFGCHPALPDVRTDQMWLIWLIDGGTVQAISVDSAPIITRSGVLRSFYRQPEAIAGGVPVWHLSNGG